MTVLSCFGLPSILNFRSPACQGCTLKIDCARNAKRVLLSLRDRIDVSGELDCLEHFLAAYTDVPLVDASPVAVETTIEVPTRSVAPDRVRVSITDAQKEQVAALPVKVASKVRALLKNGLAERALPMFRQGLNPFSRTTHGYLADAADQLLSGGFDRSGLRDYLMAKYEWTKGTAASRVSATIGVLMALEIAVEQGDRLVLGPKAQRDNDSKSKTGSDK